MPFLFGIGLSSGTVVVNVAARVESITRETGDAVLLTEATRKAAR